ncbi:MAG: TetR/AcrR family transcriptional regulator [Acidobacteria bacterium]|nr:TetR/AcrR family transcriptional regulator [Acidobacteriota bacterium]
MAAKALAQEYEDQRRQELIMATYLEVAEKGYSAVTLQDIARRAGVRKGGTLYYFATKDDLFLGALEWLVAHIHGRMHAAVAVQQDPIEKLRAMLATVFCSAQEARQFFLAYTDFISIGIRNKRFHDLNAKFYQGCECHNREIIEAGVKAGVFRAVNVDDACSMMRALVDGLMMQWFFASEMTFEDCHRRCLRVVLEYLTGKPVENVSLNTALKVVPTGA